MGEPTPRLQREPKPGAIAAALGGPLGVLTLPAGLLAAYFLTAENVDPEARLTALASLLIACVAVGVPLGFLGASVAVRVRRRRYAEWPIERTCFVGAYLGGLLSAPFCCFPLGLAGMVG